MLFHVDVFFPSYLDKIIPKGEIKLAYSQHAIREAQVDKYGLITLPAKLNIDNGRVIEVDDTKKKIVVRYSWDNRRDVTFVVAPCRRDKNRWYLVTVWSNLKSDKHKTLDKSKYYGA